MDPDLQQYSGLYFSLLERCYLALGPTVFSPSIELNIAFDSYIPGYFFMGLGGPFMFISSMQLSNAFPRNSGQVLSILTGSFDASSCIFLLYRLAYYNGFKVSPHVFFLVYLFFPVLSIVVQICFMPKDSYKSEFEIMAEAAEARREPRETTGLLSEDHARFLSPPGVTETDLLEAYGPGRRGSVFTIPKDRRISYDTTEHHHHIRNPVTGAMQGKKSLEQIKSPWWMYFLLRRELMAD